MITPCWCRTDQKLHVGMYTCLAGSMSICDAMIQQQHCTAIHVATLRLQKIAQFQVFMVKELNGLSAQMFDAISNHCVLIRMSSVCFDIST